MKKLFSLLTALALSLALALSVAAIHSMSQ